MENFIKDNKLIPQKDWEVYIESLETDFNKLETNKERAERSVRQAIEDAVHKRADYQNSFGILLSGGVDSALIAFLCSQLKKDFTCYSIGIENSQDIESAQQFAKEYNLKHRFKILTLDEFEKTITSVISILQSADIVWVSVGAVVYAASSLALEDSQNILFSGLGTEEIFAGYQRHDEAAKTNFEALHKECWSGLQKMWHRDLLRDSLIANHLEIELRTPYMDEEVIVKAMSVHPLYKISEDQKKVILREIAEDLGLAKEFAWRKKKAAQYGSNFVRGIDKLARRAGFQTKKEYLESLLKEVKGKNYTITKV